MTLDADDFKKIQEMLDHQFNGKLDAKLNPIHEELAKVNFRLDKIDDRLDAHYHLINKDE